MDSEIKKIEPILKSREHFKAYIEDGNTISYHQLRKLNSQYRKDYHGKIIRDSDQIKKSVHG